MIQCHWSQLNVTAWSDRSSLSEGSYHLRRVAGRPPHTAGVRSCRRASTSAEIPSVKPSARSHTAGCWRSARATAPTLRHKRVVRRVAHPLQLRVARGARDAPHVGSSSLPGWRRSDEPTSTSRICGTLLTARNQATEPVTAASRRGEQPDAEALDRAARLDADFQACRAVGAARATAWSAELHHRGIVETVAGSVAASQALLAEADTISHDDLVAAIQAGDATRAAQEAGEFLDRMIASIEKAT